MNLKLKCKVGIVCVLSSGEKAYLEMNYLPCTSARTEKKKVGIPNQKISLELCSCVDREFCKNINSGLFITVPVSVTLDQDPASLLFGLHLL